MRNKESASACKTSLLKDASVRVALGRSCVSTGRSASGGLHTLTVKDLSRAQKPTEGVRAYHVLPRLEATMLLQAYGCYHRTCVTLYIHCFKIGDVVEVYGKKRKMLAHQLKTAPPRQEESEGFVNSFNFLGGRVVAGGYFGVKRKSKPAFGSCGTAG